ncbi:Cof-type HAD-IIB family hydrolase [Macrococcus equipercicus]|uniref:Cof-type HAD-IIB family hydrolase n=1 Tax=Macrococcus equipercicus TaxID=69967 RepID=A0A9Q9BUT1_9STAP|nr:Cof-type HAD-IIB family hydrolase [Macrococcus equipercicus]UTH14526.1 Cof-type HAD-IIB family hydrolase [Macrococcus equipercicus]
MTRKLIFFDVDGTIYNSRTEIPEATHQAIRQLKANGHILAIASGRAPFTLEKVCRDTEIHNFVSFNGQYVVYNNEVIHENPLDIEALRQLEEQAAEREHPMVYFTHNDMVSNVNHHEHIEKSLSSIKINHPRFEAEYFERHPIYQALIFHEASDDVLYDNQYDALKFYRWHEVSRDVVPSSGSKAEGIKKFAEKLGIAQQDCIAVGDGNNDFEMIAWAGIGIAMGNAVDGLKASADYITAHVDDDGIYKAFKQLQMI